MEDINTLIKLFIRVRKGLVNGSVFLGSLSDNLLLVSRNAADFCMLVLCPAALLNSVVHAGTFVVAS